MEADLLARKLQNNNHSPFWKDVKVMNNHKTPLPSYMAMLVTKTK